MTILPHLTLVKGSKITVIAREKKSVLCRHPFAEKHDWAGQIEREASSSYQALAPPGVVHLFNLENFGIIKLVFSFDPKSFGINFFNPPCP